MTISWHTNITNNIFHIRLLCPEASCLQNVPDVHFKVKARIAFSDHAFPELEPVQLKATKVLCGGGGESIKLSLSYVRTLF